VSSSIILARTDRREGTDSPGTVSSQQTANLSRDEVQGHAGAYSSGGALLPGPSALPHLSSQLLLACLAVAARATCDDMIYCATHTCAWRLPSPAARCLGLPPTQEAAAVGVPRRCMGQDLRSC
jgi:hypothetical protein